MEKARATFFATYLSGFKPSLFAMLFGGVTTATAVLAMVSQAGTAVPLILKTLNLPSCRTSDVYRGTQTDFKRRVTSGMSTRLVSSPSGISSKRSNARVT
ncbi:hypothetical protein ACF1BQ_017110 [Bradyrhizobium sp. RDT10]